MHIYSIFLLIPLLLFSKKYYPISPSLPLTFNLFTNKCSLSLNGYGCDRTGTSILAVKYNGGIMMAADTLGSYGSLARFRDERECGSERKEGLSVCLFGRIECVSGRIECTRCVPW